MSLYNMLFGTNPAADVLLAALGLTRAKVPRFRDCFAGKDETGGYVIVVHTRTGGGNRDAYEDAETLRVSYPGSHVAGPFNSDLQQHPLYIRDEDEEFDSTYANFYFRLPDEYAPEIRALVDNVEPVETPSEKWTALLGALGAKS